MLKIIGFVTGTALTAFVMLVFAGNDGGTGAQGALRESLERAASIPHAKETDTAISAGGEFSEASPYSTKAVLELMADVDTVDDPPSPAQPEPIMQEREIVETDPPVDTLPTEGAEVPFFAAGDEVTKTEDTPDLVGQEAKPPDDADEVGAWYAFWTPFRSEASADGFAARLGRDTDREYRVVRTGPGEYRVTFFHTNENDRRARLVEIEQVSGLVLGGGEL